MLSGCRPLERLGLYTPKGSEELEAARSLATGEIDLSEDLRSRFRMPPEINRNFEAKEWLLRRANEIGREDVRVSARYLLAPLVAASDCTVAERLLEQNVDDGASQRALAAMRQEGCEARLRRWIEEWEASFAADPSTKDEEAIEAVARCRRQLERIEAQESRESGERP
jgi:hypothetical protein